MNTTSPAGPPGHGRTPNAADRDWLALACELATLCPPSTTAFSVGAVIVGTDGTEHARGYPREQDPLDHSEESALAKLPASDDRLATATIYSSLKPCAKRVYHCLQHGHHFDETVAFPTQAPHSYKWPERNSMPSTSAIAAPRFRGLATPRKVLDGGHGVFPGALRSKLQSDEIRTGRWDGK